MFGVVMPVGPGAREVERMHDTLRMLAAHEDPGEAHLVVVDDDLEPRGLDPGWPHQLVLRTELRRRRRPDARSAMVAATLSGLAACRDRGVEQAIKLDTDVAVIAPFSEKIRRAMRHRGVGVVGSYDRTSAGSIRDWSVWEQPIARLGRRWHVTRRTDGRRVPWHKRPAERRAVRRLRDRALRQVPTGAHCLGGAYAVSGAFLREAELDWRPWVGTSVAEDVVVGILCAAAGLHMRSLVGPGEPFALAWQGLPGSPAQIAAAGHSIVHSVKAPTPEEERRLRAALCARPRPAATT